MPIQWQIRSHNTHAQTLHRILLFRLELGLAQDNTQSKHVLVNVLTDYVSQKLFYFTNYSFIIFIFFLNFQQPLPPLQNKKVKVKDSRNRPGVAQRVPGGLGSQIPMTFGTWRWWGRPHAPAVFTPRKYSWYSFSLGADSNPGPWYGRKEYVTEKSSDTIRNRSRDRPTSSAAP